MVWRGVPWCAVAWRGALDAVQRGGHHHCRVHTEGLEPHRWLPGLPSCSLLGSAEDVSRTRNYGNLPERPHQGLTPAPGVAAQRSGATRGLFHSQRGCAMPGRVNPRPLPFRGRRGPGAGGGTAGAVRTPRWIPARATAPDRAAGLAPRPSQRVSPALAAEPRGSPVNPRRDADGTRHPGTARVGVAWGQPRRPGRCRAQDCCLLAPGLREPSFSGTSSFKRCPEPARFAQTLPLCHGRAELSLTGCRRLARAGVRLSPGTGPFRGAPPPPPRGAAPGPSVGAVKCGGKRGRAMLPSASSGLPPSDTGTWGSPQQMLALQRPRGPADSPGQDR